MAAQPSASWKLNAISVPLVSVQTMRVSEARQPACLFSPPLVFLPTLLFLISIFLDDPRLEQHPVGLVFGLDIDARLILLASRSARPSPPLGTIAARREGTSATRSDTHIDDLSGTESGPSIEPVIVSQLINFYSLFVVGKRRLRCHDPAMRHNEGTSATPTDNTAC